MITVSGKALGSKKPLFEDFSVLFPPEIRGGETRLRQMIDCIVRQEVEGFRDRQQQRSLLQALTAKNISAGVDAGKIAMGASEVELQEVDEDEAVDVALQAFEDGLYLVAIDGSEYNNLDQQAALQDDSRITFIRMTLLAGG